MKTLFGDERTAHIAEQRKKARVMLNQMAIKLAPQLSMYEVFDLMIGAIEDRALCDVDEIRRRSSEVTESCRTVTRIGAQTEKDARR